MQRHLRRVRPQGAKFICGVDNVEDFAPIPNSKWVIGGDLAAANHQGHLYLFDTSNHTATVVKPSEIAIKPDKQAYPDCPGPYDPKTFGPHGVDLTRGGGAHRTLYAVNHGGREAVEVFNVDLSKGKPAFTWVGCMVAPKGFWPDNVRWGPSDKEILVGGQDATVKQVLTCFESNAVNCDVPFRIYSADPRP
jgi:hypothetical protein